MRGASHAHTAAACSARWTAASGCGYAQLVPGSSKATGRKLNHGLCIMHCMMSPCDDPPKLASHSPSLGMTGRLSTTPNCSRLRAQENCDMASGPRPMAKAATCEHPGNDGAGVGLVLRLRRNLGRVVHSFHAAAAERRRTRSPWPHVLLLYPQRVHTLTHLEGCKREHATHWHDQHGRPGPVHQQRRRCQLQDHHRQAGSGPGQPRRQPAGHAVHPQRGRDADCVEASVQARKVPSCAGGEGGVPGLQGVQGERHGCLIDRLNAARGVVVVGFVAVARNYVDRWIARRIIVITPDPPERRLDRRDWASGSRIQGTPEHTNASCFLRRTACCAVLCLFASSAGGQAALWQGASFPLDCNTADVHTGYSMHKQERRFAGLLSSCTHLQKMVILKEHCVQLLCTTVPLLPSGLSPRSKPQLRGRYRIKMSMKRTLQSAE